MQIGRPPGAVPACPLDRGGERHRRELPLARQRAGADPPHDLELPVEMLDHRGAALDPVAAIDVAQAEIVADHGVMDVAQTTPSRPPRRRASAASVRSYSPMKAMAFLTFSLAHFDSDQ